MTVPGAGSGPVARELQAQVNDALAGAGLQVRAVPAPPPVVADDGTSLRSSSGRLGIRFANSDNGVNNELLVGISTLSMYARNEDAQTEGLDLDDAPAEVSAAPSTTPAAGSAGLAAPSVPALVDPPVAGAGTARPTRVAVQQVISAASQCGWECV